MQAVQDIRGVWNITDLERWEITYAGMIDNLKSNKSFKFARYGDGEIYCMNGRSGMNCDGHSYFPELGQALRESITPEPKYMVGIQPLSVSHLRQHVDSYFGHFDKLYNADVLHNASIEGSLDKFVNALTGHYVILVGPAHLSAFFANCVHIVIPNRNCWLEYESIRQQIAFHIEGVNNAVVLLAASMMSEVLISDFAEQHHTFIDVGSVLDPYCNVRSRRYHYKLKL